MNYHPVQIHSNATSDRCCTQPSERCANCKVRLHSICAALEPEELRELDALAHPASFKSKQTLFLEGDDAANTYNITEGAVRLYKMLSDGRRQIVGFALPGDFLGLTLGEKHRYSADTIGEVRLCRFPRTGFLKMVGEKPHLLRRLHDFAGNELNMAQDQMALLGRLTAEEKIATFIVGMRARWTRLEGPSVTVPLPMTRQDIADYLGLTIETVSRGFARLTREKRIINVPDGVRLIDAKSLESLAA